MTKIQLFPADTKWPSNTIKYALGIAFLVPKPPEIHANYAAKGFYYDIRLKWKDRSYR